MVCLEIYEIDRKYLPRVKIPNYFAIWEGSGDLIGETRVPGGLDSFGGHRSFHNRGA